MHENSYVTAETVLARISDSLGPVVAQIMAHDASFWGLADWTPGRIAARRDRHRPRMTPGGVLDGTDRSAAEIERRVCDDILGSLATIAAQRKLDLFDGRLSSWQGRLGRQLGADNAIFVENLRIAERVLGRIAYDEPLVVSPAGH